MNKKETLEFVLNGLKDQFTELGKEIGIDGNSANVAQARIKTGNAILCLGAQLNRLEEEETQSLTIKEEPGYKNMSDYGKCIVELIDNIGTLKASGYTNTLLVDMLEEHIENDSVKYDVKEINEVFKNETGYFEG